MKQILSALVGRDLAQLWAGAVQAMLDVAEANTDLRRAHLLAQVLHETSGLRLTEENLNYSAARLRAVWPSRFTAESAARLAHNSQAIANYVYADRLGNGPPSSGDGWRYRGRGLIQLTGKTNYAQYQAAVGSPVVSDPDRVAKPPDAALAAAWYWSSRQINRHADRDDLEAVTRTVNGGLNGLDGRRRWLRATKQALSQEPHPERIGEFEVSVLHGLTPKALLVAFDAVLAGEDHAMLGPAVVSRTGDRKVDVRLVGP